MSAALLEDLRRICGPANLLVGGDLSAYEHDWRRRMRGHALAVALPGSTQEVAEVVKACQRHQVAIVPQGGNTGLAVGSVRVGKVGMVVSVISARPSSFQVSRGGSVS